jgi:hypothetical protein
MEHSVHPEMDELLHSNFGIIGDDPNFFRENVKAQDPVFRQIRWRVEGRKMNNPEKATTVGL